MTATTIRVQMAQRKDTAANWTAANPILLSGEIGYETDSKKFKIGDGSSNWNTLAYLPIPDGSGNLTITGNLEIGTTGSLTFEGSTADGFETTLAVTDPTADRTITFPDRSGTVITSGDTGTVTSTMLADGTIVNADISATAEIAVSKLANGTANQVLVTDGTDVSWSDNLTLAGNLTVNGTTTTIDTETLLVEDKNIEMGVVATPTDVTADGGGITLRGTTDKTINWIDSTDSWTSSEHVDLASGKSYRINNNEVLSSTTLGSGVTGSSLTSVGTIGTGVWQGTAIDAVYLDSSVVTTGDTGTVTSTMIADGTIVNADVNASAAIVGTKISPNFGSQNVVTTGTSTAASFTPTSSTAPTNGLYLSASNSVALSTNGTGRLFVDASGNINIDSGGVYYDAVNNRLAVGTTTPQAPLSVSNGGANGIEIYSNYTGIGQSGIVSYNRSTSQRTDLYISTDKTIFVTSGSERARIDSSGRLLVGTSTALADASTVSRSLQIAGITAATAGQFIARFDNSANAPGVVLGKSRGATVGTYTVVNSGDQIGRLAFDATDGTKFVNAALITAEVDGTPGTNDMPGRLVFSTTSDASASPTERLRITSAGVLQVADAGNIAVGTTTGTKIGTATTQKLGFFNATPVVQPAAVADATDAATVITQLNDLLAKLRTLGIIAT